MNEPFHNFAPSSAALPTPTRPDTRVRPHLLRLARLALDAVSGTACIVEWRTLDEYGVVSIPNTKRWTAALTAVLAAVHRAGGDPIASCDPIYLSSARLLELLGGDLMNGTGYEAVAIASRAGSSSALATLLAPRGHAMSELAAAAEATVEGALRAAQLHDLAQSREFWRTRAIEAGGRLAEVNSTLTRRDADQQRIHQAALAVAKLRPRNRFAGLGEILAEFGKFDAWLLAILSEGELRTAASSAVFAAPLQLPADSAMAESVRLKTMIGRRPGASGANEYYEDRLFARFSSYVCLPYAGGAIALATRDALDPETLAELEQLLESVEPTIAKWLSEREIARLRRLVGTLGTRMFTAVEGERARIARDLHDHQAQLLAAARIALEAGPDEAREIFKQVEDALRLRVRELRPATLGRSTLEEALRYELRRLVEAGIKGRLIHARRMGTLTRAVQQLCYQTAREALSNVVRHSGAKRVEISVEKCGGRVSLTIRDDGKGFDAKAALKPPSRAAARGNRGIGLNGLAERLGMMGGKLKIDSRAGSTRVIAEIPEPA
ncbi:MAG TPA: ATP-binding protein [Candidatus Binataceae bacterium]|nr:ATP-binding protein [Candidatus Binataceae bacterium]